MSTFANRLLTCSLTGAVGLGSVLLGCGQSEDLNVAAIKVDSGCTSDTDCKSGETCNTTSGKCAAKTTPASTCKSDADCKSSDKPLCNPTTSQCEAGSGPMFKDCATTEPKCDTNYVCVAGLNKCAPDCRIAATPCPPGTAGCNMSTGECDGGGDEACTSDAGCPSSAKPHCNLATSQCEAASVTACTSDASCTSPATPRCNPTTGKCEADSDPALEDCASTTPKCKTDYVCIAGPNKCAPDCRVAATPCPPDMGECNQDTGECASNSAPVLEPCASTTPKCKTDYVCVTGMNVCAPDCRVAATPCPPDRGECIQSTGECSGVSG
jgi:hypothetical protein